MAGKHSDPQKLYLREKLTCRAEVGKKVFNFTLRIEDITKVGIVTDKPDIGGLKLSVGQEMMVRYYRQDSAYQFLTKVISETTEGLLPQIIIAFPKQIIRFQRRNNTRAKVDGTVRFYPEGQMANPIRGFMENISSGGIQFTTKQAGMFNTAISPVGKSLTIALTISGGYEFVGLQGDIRRISKDGLRPGFIQVHVQLKGLKKTVKEKLELIARKNM